MRKFIAVALALAFAGVGGAATSVRPMSLEELVRGSECVVLADVESVSSQWDAEGRMIYTYVTLKVAECWKGAPAQTVVVRVPGGQVGDVRVRVSESPVFLAGERVAAFLRSRNGATEVTGWFRGKLTVTGSEVREMRNKTLGQLRADVQALAN
ncbi:MAG TPA: hypothetical protein VEI02_07190 [Planctomycetota bacterium]|nr:hypothetical protein [Planctomycetota bacterium]